MANTTKTKSHFGSDAVTLADIARRCNLSKGSVSRALSMSAETCPLSPKTWQRVRKISQEMGYRVNAQARALASGKSMSIGLLYEGTMPVLDSVYHEIVDSFAATLREHGYHLGLVALDETDQWEDVLLGGRIDGCVCLHSFPKRLESSLTRINRPIVLLNGKSAFASGSVSVDERHGAAMVTEHLIKLGHRRILMFTDTHRETPHHSIPERQTGFLSTMRGSDCPDAEPLCFEGTPEAFAEAWPKLPHKPTAVVCYSHLEAVHALRVLKQAGVDVPGQVNIATFNDVFPVADLDPPLTCVNIQPADIGRAGGQLLLELLRAGGRKPLASRKSVVIEPSLIVRESTRAANH